MSTVSPDSRPGADIPQLAVATPVRHHIDVIHDDTPLTCTIRADATRTVTP